MNTYGLVDDRNLALWNSINENREIEIVKENRTSYSTYSKGDKSTIRVPIDNLDVESFTHELLHIYLTNKGVLIGGGLKICVNDSQFLKNIFPERLIDHIGNCLEHIKILPDFLNMGFERSTFLSDYSENKLTNEEIETIEKSFCIFTNSENIYIKEAIDCFVGKYFAAQTCSNYEWNYDFQLQRLKNVDTDLYIILESFLNAWNDYDYTDSDPVKSDYHVFLFEFIDSLEAWAAGKKIL